jgi:hypothetical protein
MTGMMDGIWGLIWSGVMSFAELQCTPRDVQNLMVYIRIISKQYDL